MRRKWPKRERAEQIDNDRPRWEKKEWIKGGKKKRVDEKKPCGQKTFGK